MTLRALGVPRRAHVRAGSDGVPRAVEVRGASRAVSDIRDDWLVQDLWWTDRPVDRHYHEVVLESGRVVLTYRDHVDGSWYVHG